MSKIIKNIDREVARTRLKDVGKKNYYPYI